MTLILHLCSPRFQRPSDLQYQDYAQRRGSKCHISTLWEVSTVSHPGTGLASSFEDDGSAEWVQD